MIEYKDGNILDEKVDAIVNAVNCVGVMGKGLAKQFKNKYPSNFKSYVLACLVGDVQPGKLHIFDTEGIPKYIVNLPTKKHWCSNSSLEYINLGLKELINFITKHNIQSIAIPAIGCGLGGLKWDDVRSLIELHMNQVHNVRVVIFNPIRKGL